METVVITAIIAIAAVQLFKIVCALMLVWHYYDVQHPHEQEPHREAKPGGIPPVKRDDDQK